MSAAEIFEKQRWIYFDKVITREECNSLVEHMFDLSKLGKLEKDEQCPLSESCYGDPLFDHLLEQLAKPLSNHLGIELLPTYTYARIYKPGEVLERHSDRPSCEISGTLTLGFDPSQAVWPIYFAKDENDLTGYPIDIAVGDLVMYRGNELPHWRPKFKGTWQVQVFLHYVDANGPHKDYKYDKRPKLGVGAEHKGKVDDKPFGEWTHNAVAIGYQDNLCPDYSSFNSTHRPDLTFSEEECKKIIELSNTQYSNKAGVGSDTNNTVALEIRNVNRYEINYNKENSWIFDKIAAAVATANSEYYKYDLLGILHGIELLHYNGEEECHYNWHTDTGPGRSSTRKISVSVQLSNENDYEGGNLEVNTGILTSGCKEQGSISMFPSYALHRVSPVTKGDRWVLVIWVHGSSRFR